MIIDKETEKETMTEVLQYIADYFGISYDKYSKENLNITWDKHGHKTENEINK